MPEQPRDRPAKPRLAGASPAVASIFHGAVAQKRRAGDLQSPGRGCETRRSPPITMGAHVPQGRVAFAARLGGCKFRRLHQFGPACSVEARIPGRDSEEGATPFRSTSLHAREVLRDAWLSSKQREPARYRPRAPYGADVQGDGLVSKTDRQGAIPWRRANLPPVAQTAEQAIDNRQRPVQVRTGGPFYSAAIRRASFGSACSWPRACRGAWAKAHRHQTISGVSVKRAADPFGGQADLVMARA